MENGLNSGQNGLDMYGKVMVWVGSRQTESGQTEHTRVNNLPRREK